MIAFCFACVYWGGVAVNAVRIRRRTGKTPSVRPRTGLDYLLWLAWLAAVALWTASPWLAGEEARLFDSRPLQAAGLTLAVLGVAGTWWCYATLGNAWAISVDTKQTTKLVKTGPYGLALHPIYSLQWLVLFGVFLAEPSAPLLAALLILTVAMQIKAKVEEKVLEGIFGTEYADYARRVGRFFPRFLPGETSRRGKPGPDF